MKRWQKCKCGFEYEGFRSQCPECFAPCEQAKPCNGWFFAVEAYLEDENLEKELNRYTKNGFKIGKWFRNEPTRGGTENSTIVFKKRVYKGDTP
jgi:hypothetical protein